MRNQSKSNKQKLMEITTPALIQLTMNNVVSITPSTRMSFKDVEMGKVKAGPAMRQYSERIVEDILGQIFAERRGFFVESSSCCDGDKIDRDQAQQATNQSALPKDPSQHVDKRLAYWREMLQTRRRMQKRVQLQTGKGPEHVLFNRRSTLENRNKETVLRLMDYAERLHPERLKEKPIAALKPLQHPCTGEFGQAVSETWPRAEQEGAKAVEIIGLPEVVQQELLGTEAAGRELQHSWIQSPVLDTRIDGKFKDICKVLEFFPELDKLQVTGTNVAKLQSNLKTELLEEERLVTISTSSDGLGSEEQMYDSWMEPVTAELDPELEPPELGLKINGRDFIVCEQPFTECFDVLTKFACNPFQRRAKIVLRLKNIGRQALSFKWSQGIFYYNRGSLLLAQDNEFFFETDNFRLTFGETYDLKVLYQPRKVSMAVELWRLHIEPCIFCGHQESLQLRFHGRCTPPKEYMTLLRELHCASICKSNTATMEALTGNLAELVPLIEPPPACCPYERSLDEREVFNSLNPGYNCERFDDLEVLKGMHKHLKMPREPQWDLRLDTIKALIMRIESPESRQEMYSYLLVVLESLLGKAPSLEETSRITEQKQRTRFIYVRGVICNGIEEWEDLVITIEGSFYNAELHRFYLSQLEEVEEEDDVKPKPKAVVIEAKDGDSFDEQTSALVIKQLRHSKYLHDSLYIQTYSHLCNIAETIVSVIESTDVVPT